MRGLGDLTSSWYSDIGHYHIPSNPSIPALHQGQYFAQNVDEKEEGNSQTTTPIIGKVWTAKIWSQ